MNERIKELALQAEQYADDTMNADPATYDKAGQVKVWRELMQAKFAELIVKEVLDEVLQAMDDGMDVYDTVADKFGVEE